MTTTTSDYGRQTRVEYGRRFYTWTNIATVGGSVGIVTLIWEVLQSLSTSSVLLHNWVPFVISLVLLGSVGLLTEPTRQETSWQQKAQKLIQAVVNGFFVYAIVVGLPVAASNLGQ